MENRPDIGLESYDRLFANQDTLPQGGFGNLIALPLQKRARDQGNSVFLDDELNPWPDQCRAVPPDAEGAGQERYRGVSLQTSRNAA